MGTHITAVPNGITKARLRPNVELTVDHGGFFQRRARLGHDAGGQKEADPGFNCTGETNAIVLRLKGGV